MRNTARMHLVRAGGLTRKDESEASYIARVLIAVILFAALYWWTHDEDRGDLLDDAGQDKITELCVKRVVLQVNERGIDCSVCTGTQRNMVSELVGTFLRAGQGEHSTREDDHILEFGPVALLAGAITYCLLGWNTTEGDAFFTCNRQRFVITKGGLYRVADNDEREPIIEV